MKVKDFTRGIWENNPVFVQVLGMCPTLAVTTALINGLGMGLATMFVLFCSNLIVSLVKDYIPNKVRIPSFIVIIATFVTIVDLVMKGYFPALSKSLGIFVPLIVVNCIILGRAEAFASKKTVVSSMLDALGMGVGFTLALVLLGSIRELLGTGMIIIGTNVLVSTRAQPINFLILAPGAFLTLGLLLGLFKHIAIRREKLGKSDSNSS